MAKRTKTTLSLNVQKFGLAVGFTFAIFLFALGFISGTPYGLGADVVKYSSSLFPGYSSTIFGAILGAIWGFIYGLIFGTLLAYLYNFQMR